MSIKNQEEVAREVENQTVLKKKDDRLQRQLNEDERRSQLEAKVQLEQVRNEERQKSSAEHWAKVKKTVDEFTRLDEHAGQAAFTQWQTNMMNILGAVNVLSTALYHDDSHFRFLKCVFSPVSPIINVGIAGVDALLGLNERQLQKTIPTINYTIAVDENGELTTEVYQDAIPLPDAQKQLFDIGAVAWLKEQGYDFVPDPLNPNIYVLISQDDKTKRLTPELLKTLEHNEAYGLGAFFQNQRNINLVPQPDVMSSFSP
jgi:hypothetical protein